MSERVGEINTLIKLDIDRGELIDNPSDINENNENNGNKENSENYNYSNIDNISIDKHGLKLEEDDDDNNNQKTNIKNNPKNNNKNASKKFKKRNRLTMDLQEEIPTVHPRKIYTEEEKIQKANENTLYFNWDLMNKRNELNIHFLKRKIEQSYERDDKLQVFFNVPFFPKEEMFMAWQLASNKNNFYSNLNRNSQYNKMGMMPNRNVNYPNSMRYPNNNINNNNMVKNNNVGNMNNNMKNYGQNNYNMNNNNNTQVNKNINNLNQINKIQNNIPNPNNKINQPLTTNNNNNNNIQYTKPTKPILDTSLLKDGENKFNPIINKNDNHNMRKTPLFALTTDSPNKNEINQSTKKENENNNEIKEPKKEDNSEVKEIDINIETKAENKN